AELERPAAGTGPAVAPITRRPRVPRQHQTPARPHETPARPHDTPNRPGTQQEEWQWTSV
ncbi:hypothetical protein, partial [Streptomyces sp. SID3212]|uniref:hypothetical protein n=1 Tax=Streptomyces sp. SID3212 TaxID=2690259 RepID=UPI001F3D75C4